MIRATVVIQGGPRAMLRDFRKLVRDGLQDLVKNVFHRQLLPKHFERSAGRRYKYKPRTERYLRRKARKRPAAGPLEYSGLSKRQLQRKIRISGTSKRASGAMSAPRYFYVTGKNLPDKPEEVTRVTKTEAKMMAKVLNNRVTKRLNVIKDIQVRR